jgi:hypothetical protein
LVVVVVVEMGNGGGGGEPSVIKGGGGGGGAVVGRGRGPRPRGEMTGWGGQHHRPPLRPRGRAGRGAGRGGAVRWWFCGVCRVLSRRAAGGCGRQEGRWDVMARAPHRAEPPCRGGRGRPRLRSRAALPCAVLGRDGWVGGEWRPRRGGLSPRLRPSSS